MLGATTKVLTDVEYGIKYKYDGYKYFMVYTTDMSLPIETVYDTIVCDGS
jgi:hypothetical protein